MMLQARTVYVTLQQILPKPGLNVSTYWSTL